jgi:RNA polymerase sigma-70 factor (ECF subfamily)
VNTGSDTLDTGSSGPAPRVGAPVGHALDEVFRREAGRCTATLIRVLGDVDAAEDAVADAFAIASQRWPVDGVPPNPGGWITTTARNRAIDRLRRDATRDQRHRAAQRLIDGHNPESGHTHDSGDDQLDLVDAFVEVVDDDQLRLVFLCCHPALSPDAQVALTLRLLGGLDTAEIARGFLVPEATMAQRIVRAKRKLRDNHATYRIPEAAELPARLAPVLAAISLIFTEGHTATSGDELVRTDLSAEAIRLGRVLVALMPDEPEAVGLLALMLLTDARRPARVADDGTMVRLLEQDRTRWDRALIDEGHGLVRACLRRDQPGPFQIQAAISAVHADAPTASATDWDQIVALYDQLLTVSPTPVVALNRAAAVAEGRGVDAGLAALDQIDARAGSDAVALEGYQPFHATRADLLARAGRRTEALDAYDRALALTTNPAERRFLAERRATVALVDRQPADRPTASEAPAQRGD